MNTYQFQNQPRILRRPEVLKITGWSKSTLYNRIDSHHFITPIPLGQRSVGFVSTEVYAIVNAMIKCYSPQQIKELVQELTNQRNNSV
ncbi:AlpA family phage regulatory protein [Pseudocolwellia sp. AS88]|uniref:helix-turn-helix transcriptional regulator n=1 Tax=Pseudocolwellia sp. AS88 TaxID=3063958 RepID=UPI0026F2E0B5|nr:AlpA family phage regulatory protein [Pseudocolwellia sp. AS88]MDO7084015.1 AlpA family phage regulatory protein [Pseudocolwellia sp. AS88]